MAVTQLHSNDSSRRRRGSSMVELAIVLPLLFAVFFAIAEFSMMFLNYQTVTTAAREGARTATLYRPNCTIAVAGEVDAAVTNVLASAGLSGAPPVLSGACVYPGTSSVTVSVPYDFRLLPGFAQAFGYGSIHLTATSVMQNEFTGS